MRYFNWLWRAALFVALLGFAIKNGQIVTLNYFFGYAWESSLVIILLIFFSAGVIVGVVAILPESPFSIYLIFNFYRYTIV